jgi:hypothetical protein
MLFFMVRRELKSRKRCQKRRINLIKAQTLYMDDVRDTHGVIRASTFHDDNYAIPGWQDDLH